MIQHHSPVSQAAYDDLKRLCLDEAVSDIRGTPVKTVIKGRGYLYDRYRLGGSLADPIHEVSLYRSGVLVQVPRPEAYAIHKLIVADRRRDGADGAKARKDRAQAAFLIEALSEDRPDELAEAYADALARGPRWRARLGASLDRMPDSRARLDALI